MYTGKKKDKTVNKHQNKQNYKLLKHTVFCSE